MKDGVLQDLEKVKIVDEDVDAWDVDYIEVKTGQTFVDEDGNRYNTNPNDKNAKTPNPNTGEETIKLQPGIGDFIPNSDDANDGVVTITGDNSALQIETSGPILQEPSVKYDGDNDAVEH